MSRRWLVSVWWVLLLTPVAAGAVPLRTAPTPCEVTETTDIVYASRGGRELRLDLYRPRPGKGPFPAVVYIHGGGWRSGSRRQLRRYAIHMAAAGFVGAAIEYRLSGEAKYPAAVDDARAAVAWLRENAASYDVDPHRIGVVGQSAGGHLAALLGVGVDAESPVQAVAVLNAVLDLPAAARANPLATGTAITSFLGYAYTERPELWSQASPLSHVSCRSSPMLLLHGTDDTVVPFAQSVAMSAALERAGVPVELSSATGVGHLWFFNSEQAFQASAARIEEFLRKWLGSR